MEKCVFGCTRCFICLVFCSGVWVRFHLQKFLIHLKNCTFQEKYLSLEGFPFLHHLWPSSLLFPVCFNSAFSASFSWLAFLPLLPVPLLPDSLRITMWLCFSRYFTSHHTVVLLSVDPVIKLFHEALLRAVACCSRYLLKSWRFVKSCLVNRGSFFSVLLSSSVPTCFC